MSLRYHSTTYWVSLVAQMVKNLLAVQETWFWTLGWEDPLEKGVTTYSSILAWRIPWTEEPGGLQSMGLQGVRQDWATNTHTHTHTHTATYWLRNLGYVISSPWAPVSSLLKDKILTISYICYVIVQLLSCVWLFVTLWTTGHQTSLSFTTSQSLLKLMSIEPVMPSNQQSHPLSVE